MGDETSIKKLVLAVVIVVTLSVVTLMGVAITGEYSETLRAETTVNLSTTSIITTLATNGTGNTVGATSQYGFLKDLDNCVNVTNSTDADGSLTKNTDYIIAEGDADGGSLILLDTALAVRYIGSDINCSTLTYLEDTDAQAAADLFTTGLGIFAAFMGVLALAIVGKAVIGLFKTGKD